MAVVSESQARLQRGCAVPGLDVAGTVAATGADVTRFEVGDEVFGISQGSFADYACARGDKLARKPASLTFDQAAARPGLRTDRPPGSDRRRAPPAGTTC